MEMSERARFDGLNGTVNFQNAILDMAKADYNAALKETEGNFPHNISFVLNITCK
jgi:hypothetical protein